MTDGRDPVAAQALANDDALLQALRSGAPDAFAHMVHLTSGRVYGIALAMLRNEQDARDVVQDTFLNVHRALPTFRGDAPLQNWIARIAANHALMKLRRRRRKPEEPLTLRGPTFDDSGHHERAIVDWSPLAEHQHVDAELGRKIRDAVDALPDSYRAVVVLADFQEMPMKDIAEALGLTVPNVKTRLHRARLALREALADYLDGRC